MSKRFEAVTIPKWGIEMTQGRIAEWRYAEGAQIKAGDELVDIETDKIVNSFEARESGTLACILAPEGEELAVGTLIGVIAIGDYDSAQLAAFIAEHQGIAESSNQPAETTTAQDDVATGSSTAAKKISPALLRKLDKAGIDVSQVEGTGPEGRVLKEDVDKIMASNIESSPAVGGTSMTAAQQKIGASLTVAQSTVPLYHVSRELDVGPALTQLGAQLPQSSGLITVLIVQAVAKALEQFPALNMQFNGADLMPVANANIAIAVARDDGAVAAPVIGDVNSKAAPQIADELTELINRARAGRSTAQDMMPAAIAISNLGMFGVESFTAMVTPPQVMVLSVGRAEMKPVWDASKGLFSAAQRVSVSLGADHRVINGAQAAQFLQAIAKAI
ncbi:2-oxo acid dehydrogenase subunit E2 [bacterium]|nr:2-oxo acid dehydrogenase subunit E2 [bacterium]